MALNPQSYALAGEALFNKDWVYGMRALLDIRKTNAEQIALANAHSRPFEIPARLQQPIYDALQAKIMQCLVAIEALTGEGDPYKEGPADGAGGASLGGNAPAGQVSPHERR